MLSLNKCFEENQKGFTLVELIISLAILAVLAGVAIPKFTGILAKSKQDANDTNVKMIAHAAELYYESNNQVFPADIDVLVSAGYLKENPTQPVKGTDEYSISHAGSTLTVIPGLCSSGVPKIDGSEFEF
jgi:prepilin-type N-terminal cleavage/methylation domain-containing protein